MDILTPEKEIVERLKAELGVTVHVQAYPNNPEGFEFTQPGGAVLVRYNASGYARPVANRNGLILQDRSPEWTCALLHRHLASHEGIYVLLESVRKALTGFTPSTLPLSTMLIPVRDRFVDRQPGKWIYEIVFSQTFPESQA